MSKYSETQNPRSPSSAGAVSLERRTGEIPRREIMTPREAADYLSVHVRTIYRLAKNGEIPGRKVGGSWRFKKGALDEWLSWREGPPPKGKGQ
jgi:excisionase family DNA binding protein